MEVLCSRKEDMGIVRYVEGSRRDMEWVVRVEEVLEKWTKGEQAPQSIDQPFNLVIPNVIC